MNLKNVMPLKKEIEIIEAQLKDSKNEAIHIRLKEATGKLNVELYQAEKYIESIGCPKTRSILRLYFCQGLTQEEIGVELGYSQSAISLKLKPYI